MMLETLEDILPIFGAICSGSVQPLSCGIWLTYKNYTQELKEKISQFVQDCQNAVSSYRVSFNHSEVIFKNGSIIRFIVANEHQRGYRFHFSVYDWEIEDDLIHNIIMSKSCVGFPPKSIQINYKRRKQENENVD